MGMPISVLVRGRADCLEAADAPVSAAFAELRDIDEVFSPYKATSVVSAIGSGPLCLAESPSAVRAVAELCVRARELTGGLFDPTRPDGVWEPSGLVKGWAVQRAARHLAELPDLDWCLNAGGDAAIRCRDGRSFTVGIEDPKRPGRLVAGRPAVPAASPPAARPRADDTSTTRARVVRWKVRSPPSPLQVRKSCGPT